MRRIFNFFNFSKILILLTHRHFILGQDWGNYLFILRRFIINLSGLTILAPFSRTNLIHLIVHILRTGHILHLLIGNAQHVCRLLIANDAVLAATIDYTTVTLSKIWMFNAEARQLIVNSWYLEAPACILTILLWIGISIFTGRLVMMFNHSIILLHKFWMLIVLILLIILILLSYLRLGHNAIYLRKIATFYTPFICQAWQHFWRTILLIRP